MITRLCLCIVLGWGLIPFAAGTAVEPDENWTPGEWEAYLKSAEVMSVEPDENAGRSEPWRITLSDGAVKRRAWFKHIDQRRPHPIADSFRYEMAAYRIDRLMESGLVPPTVERVIEGVRGSLQLFVEDCRSLEEIRGRAIDIPGQDAFFRNMRDVQVFENLTACSHSDEDVLVHPETGRICRVDFSQAFHPRAELSPEQDVRECSVRMVQGLKKLDPKILADELKEYLNNEEIEALLERRLRIIERLEK